jgi:hypothetical protein
VTPGSAKVSVRISTSGTSAPSMRRSFCPTGAKSPSGSSSQSVARPRRSSASSWRQAGGRQRGEEHLAELEVTDARAGGDARRQPPQVAQPRRPFDVHGGEMGERDPEIPPPGEHLEPRADARVGVGDRQEGLPVARAGGRGRSLARRQVAGGEHVLAHPLGVERRAVHEGSSLRLRAGGGEDVELPGGPVVLAREGEQLEEKGAALGVERV